MYAGWFIERGVLAMYLLGHRCSSYVKTRACPDASLGEGGRVGGCVCVAATDGLQCT